MKLAFSVHSLSKIYEMGEERVVALDSINLDVQRATMWQSWDHRGQGKAHYLIY